MTDLPDSQLIALARNTNAEAFELLIRRHGHAAAGLIRRMTPDPHEAEDVLQETLLQAWRRLEQLEAPERFVGWLVQIARNQCRMRLRRRIPEVALPDIPEPRPRVGRLGRGTADSHAEQLDKVLEALNGLAGDDAHTARLFYLAGLSIREVAEATASPEGTVKRRLHSARNRIRDTLRKEGNP